VAALGSLLQRVLWKGDAGIEAEGSLDRGVMARAFALLYGAGGTLVLVTVALSSSDDRFIPGMVGPALVAYGVVALTLVGLDRLPLLLFEALPGFGALLITIVAVSSDVSSFNAYALLYFWVVVSAFYFFDWKRAAPALVLCAGGYALALFVHDGAQYPLLYWVMGAGTLTIAAVLLGALRHRLEQLVGGLRESDQLKTTILRSVSHDLRTPLTAIIAAGESSASPRLDDDSRDELASVIVGEGQRLSELVDNLLDVSRLEAGSAKPRRTWCSVEEVVETVLERAPLRGDGFDVEAAPALPSILADAAQLERAFANLFENASRFSGTDPVQVRLARDGEQVVVHIADHGPGVEPVERDRIFEPFYRGRANGHGHQGPGLGLTVARGFIEANGGSVRVESTPTGGATFVVELPVDGSRPA
jgi:signal transduction histidine kinase